MSLNSYITQVIQNETMGFLIGTEEKTNAVMTQIATDYLSKNPEKRVVFFTTDPSQVPKHKNLILHDLKSSNRMRGSIGLDDLVLAQYTNSRQFLAMIIPLVQGKNLKCFIGIAEEKKHELLKPFASLAVYEV